MTPTLVFTYGNRRKESTSFNRVAKYVKHVKFSNVKGQLRVRFGEYRFGRSKIA